MLGGVDARVGKGVEGIEHGAEGNILASHTSGDIAAVRHSKGP